MRPDVNILKQHLEEGRLEFIAWVPDELQVADALTKDKTDKVGLTEMMVHGQLKATLCRTNLIYHSGQDFKIVGEALRASLIKRKKMVPKKKKVKEIQKEMKEECKAMGGEEEGDGEFDFEDEFKAEDVERVYDRRL